MSDPDEFHLMTEAPDVPDVQPVKPKPRFYSTKTLLFGEPDTNTRYIRDSVDDSVVVAMNLKRRSWTLEMETKLRSTLRELNK